MKNNYEQGIDLFKKEEQKNIKPVKLQKFKTRSKKFVVCAVALTTAGVIVVTSGIAGIVSLFKKKNNNEVPKAPNNSIVQIDDMGTELEFPENNTSKYGNTTGDINADDLVEKNGKIYKDKDSADKADKKGTSSFDNKNNTLIDEDGKIKDKNQGYEIKDETGKVVENGELEENKIPDGYAYDSVLKKYVPKAEVGKYVYSDATYYDTEGNIIINKGDVVAKETLEKAKKYLTTTKPVNKETSSSTNTSSKEETSSTTSNEGKVNADGTYTIFGLTFRSKADFEQWVLQGYEGYAEADGIMMPEEEILKQNQKTK